MDVERLRSYRREMRRPGGCWGQAPNKERLSVELWQLSFKEAG